MTTTLIKAPYIVAYQDGEHRILRDGCLVVRDDQVVHVGRSYDGPADEVIEAGDRVVTPGLISTHAHITESPIDKSLQEDIARRVFWQTGLIEVLPTIVACMEPEDVRACADYSMLELIRTGCTTVLQMGAMSEYVADAAEKAGLRAYVADMFRSGAWQTTDGTSVSYTWDEEKGRQGLARAVDLVGALDGRANGRIGGFLAPAQVDTCTEDLLRTTKEASDELGVPVSLHASQSIVEFIEMNRRHGMTPIEWLDSIGFLGPRTILGHAIVVAGSSYANYPGDDLALLAATGTSVAYNAWCFGRRGLVMETYPEYLKRGVNVCLGTDTAPQSMIESLRWTAVLGKVLGRNAEESTAKDVFDSATLRAAAAIGRDDLGRISSGAKADLLFWRTDSLFMTPLRDPIRNIVYTSQSEDLADVMIDGAWVMRDRQVPAIDEAEVTARLQRSAAKVWAKWPSADWAGRTLPELCPPTYADFV
ncbi:amidohydrolase [Spongiactinospora gelatinilytica]|uniref:Amidohydrolase n=1 Tax=Spongiactinospora gelatinilytica TaxID=2666298 RepID=A0A2W2ID49_9ACTN|nr:chlorohydrolase family protein [Spongiactinospora gelatinilytica]PZG48104.1 amidohydrolase [Spongiactinospora gelatinilytica]